MFLAKDIFERMKIILYELHNKKTFDDFNKFDYMICTANYKVLESQTSSRLIDRESGCLPEDKYGATPKEKHDYLQEHVLKYDKSAKAKMSFKERAKAEPKTLFLVVADEAHWGVTKETGSGEDPAYTTLVNTWNSEEHPNVFVLLVSATPHLLLTKNTRIPHDWKYDIHPVTQKQKLKILERGDTNKNLNHIKWAEANYMKLEQGIIITLKMPLSPLVWLMIGSEQTDGIKYLEGASDPNRASKLLIVQQNNSASIKSEDEHYILAVNSSDELVFVACDSDLPQKGDTRFEVDFHYGEDVIGLKSMKTGLQESCLGYNAQSQRVELTSQHILKDNMIFPERDNKCMFLIDDYSTVGETKATFRYHSLNFYYSTMRNTERSKQLIRHDAQFESILTEMEKDKQLPEYKEKRRNIKQNEEYNTLRDAVHASEWSYYIITHKLFRQCSMEFSYRNMLCQDNLQSFLGSFSSSLQEIQKQFWDKLPKTNNRAKVTQKTYETFKDFQSNYLLEKLKATYCDFLSADIQYSLAEAEIYWKLLVMCLFFADNESKLNTISSQLKKDDNNLSMSKRPKFIEAYENLVFKFDSMKTKILEITEIGQAVNSLIESRGTGNSMRGKLKLIRASSNAGGKVLNGTLCLARRVAANFRSAEHAYSFDIVQDYGDFSIDRCNSLVDKEDKVGVFSLRKLLQPDRCQHKVGTNMKPCGCNVYSTEIDSIKCKCGHEHETINSYQCLQNLPGILILVQKGRIGATFPDNLDMMDLRLHFRSSDYFLTLIVQEFGRMCRYSADTDIKKLPYALIGKSLYKNLKKGLETHSTFCGSFPSEKIDRKMVMEDGELAASKHSADAGNMSTTNQKNRLLLSAEPQIGKTGTYLYLIKLGITQIGLVDKEEELSSGEEDSDEEVDVISNEEYANDWQYPYWKTIRDSKDFTNKLTFCTYNRVYGPFVPDVRPELRFTAHVRKAKCNQTLGNRRSGKTLDTLPPEKYRINTSDHNCKDCTKDYTSTKTSICVHEMYVNISIPNSTRYLGVSKTIMVPFLGTSDSLELMTGFEDNVQNVTNLETWIFTPSFQRAHNGNLNLIHSMIETKQGDTLYKSFVHVLVVRKNEFDKYCKYWQSSHIVLELPDTMTDVDEDVESGGIGYARLFIQMFSETFGLSWIFMMDDSITYVYDTKMTDTVVVRNDGRKVNVKVPLYKILKHLEDQIKCKNAPAPKTMAMYEPYEATKPGTREGYTGPSHKYGVVGFYKMRKGVLIVKNPFKRNHVFSLVLINIHALQSRNINYKPWPVYEDCNLNYHCNKEGLWVVKYNRFIIQKRRVSRWAPNMYEWDKSSTLVDMDKLIYQATDEAKTICSWLTHSEKPKRVEELFIDPKDEPDIVEAKVVNKEAVSMTTNSKSNVHMMTILPSSDQTAKHFVEHYFSQTVGVSGFGKHLLQIPTSVCKLNDLITLDNIKTKLVADIFDTADENFSMIVLTSHNINIYKVKLVLIGIDGQGIKHYLLMNYHLIPKKQLWIANIVRHLIQT